MPGLLDEIEHLLEHSLEEDLFAWLPPQTSRQDTLHQILTAIASSQETQDEKVLRGDYLILVSQEDYPLWFANQIDLINFSHLLQSICKQSGYRLQKLPAFHIMTDRRMAAGQIAVQQITPPEESGETQNLNAPKAVRQVPPLTPVFPEIRAYLTNSDNEIINLVKPVTNIGRREDNDIVIPDQRVSRQHAQIRRSHQHYILFDLNSTGGTWVNNERITQATLASGDVISIAGILFIYADELVTPEDEQTNDLNGSTTNPPAGGTSGYHEGIL